MPTIDITSSPLSLPEQRRIALRLSRWFLAHGVAATRVIVQFADVPPRSVFSGGVALPTAAGDNGAPSYVSVRCCIAEDRDDAFKRALAREIRETVAADERTGYFYLRFERVDKSDVYLAMNGPLVRADADEATRSA